MGGSGKSITLISAAKVNLYLEVKGGLPDGYHDLVMLNTGVDLLDTVEVTLTAGDGIEIECAHPDVPEDETNLCHKAARFFFEAYPELKSGVKIWIDKAIPVAGGLGGGSGNAAAVLVGLNELSGSCAENPSLMHIGMKVGADVPFFLYKSPAWAAGKGEVLSPAPCLPDWIYVVGAFNFGVSAGWAYDRFDLTGGVKKVSLNYLESGEVPPLSDVWRNDLNAVVESEYPVISRAVSLLLEAGAEGAMMSGSGPTVFGVFSDELSAERGIASLGEIPDIKALTARGISGPVIRIVS